MESEKNKIKELIKNNNDLFRIICSTHYPFTSAEIRTYWDNLVKGDAYYTVYIHDTEEYMHPKYGLCWNSNTDWDDWLLNHWEFYDPNSEEKRKDGQKRREIGFWDPFAGMYRDGAFHVPLDISKEIGKQFNYLSPYISYDFNDVDESEMDTNERLNLEYDRWAEKTAREVFSKDYGELSLDVISKFLECPGSGFYKNIMITKKEIWDKTLSKWIDHEIIKDLFAHSEKPKDDVIFIP